MFDPEAQIITNDNWEILALNMSTSKELSSTFKTALKAFLKMDNVKAAREAHVLSSLMTARLLDREEK